MNVIACTDCRGSLRFEPGDRALTCADCGAVWPLRGLPCMYREAEIRGIDRFMRILYDGAPALHDPAVRLLVPLFELEGSERRLREAYMPRLELHALGRERPAADAGRPVRILEVSVGTGANLPFVKSGLASAGLPREVPVEIWGLDVSLGMMRQCLARPEHRDVRLLLGDAHRLPFRDATFDRVFHVGGLNAFRDRAAALAEMARVARPGTPLVVVDEQLDPARRHSLYHRLAFKAATFYDRNPRAPVDALPAGAEDVLVEQASRFFYTLRFRVGQRAA
jgi:SAM-dependent methyltransferase